MTGHDYVALDFVEYDAGRGLEEFAMGAARPRSSSLRCARVAQEDLPMQDLRGGRIQHIDHDSMSGLAEIVRVLFRP